MKKFRIFYQLTLPLILLSSIITHAQPVVFMQFRHIPADQTEEFIFRETNYWSQVARKAIDDGKMVNWSLWQRIGGWDMPDGHNFVFVNTFENPGDIDRINEIWASVPELFPNIPISEISTDNLGFLKHQLILRGIAGEGLMGEGPANFARINFAKVSDMEAWIEHEQNTWQPFIKGAMESGKTTQKSWRLAQLMMPAGADIPFNGLTADGYDKMSEAILPGTSFSEDIEFPDMTEINSVHKKVYIQAYSLIKSEH